MTLSGLLTPPEAESAPRVRALGLQPYEPVWRDMQRFTQERGAITPDEIWLVEHEPVFTLGLSGKTEHLLTPGNIPIVHCDRGGQVTYHGPGQLVVYPLLSLKRRQLGVRLLVTLMEQTMIEALKALGITAHARPEAPGVYVADKKIGSVGIRVRRECCYHGFSLNNAMDLSPFDHINTCGYKDLQVTSLAELRVEISMVDLGDLILHTLISHLKR